MGIIVTNEFIEMLSRGILQPLTNKQLPAKLAYHITVVIERLQAEAKGLAAAREALLKKYAVMEGNQPKTENGRVVFKDDESEAKFIEELRELFDMEVEIDIEPLEVDMDTIPLCTLGEMAPLAKLIKAK